MSLVSQGSGPDPAAIAALDAALGGDAARPGCPDADGTAARLWTTGWTIRRISEPTPDERALVATRRSLTEAEARNRALEFAVGQVYGMLFAWDSDLDVAPGSVRPEYERGQHEAFAQAMQLVVETLPFNPAWRPSLVEATVREALTSMLPSSGASLESIPSCPLCGRPAHPPLSGACIACGRVLEPVFPESCYPQFENALHLEFDGGYGEFVDGPFHEPGPLAVILCHACAHDLAARNPWIERILDPEHSHTHRPGQGHEPVPTIDDR
jgi:hypothetical protein